MMSEKVRSTASCDEDLRGPARPAYTYHSTQATHCAGCGELKHTPLRVDWMGGYVCLTCIDKALCESVDPLLTRLERDFPDDQAVMPVERFADWLLANLDALVQPVPGAPHAASEGAVVAVGQGGSDEREEGNELERLRQRVAELEQALVDDAVRDTLLTDMAVRNGMLTAGFEGGACRLVADALAGQFEASGAVNYIEMQLSNRRLGPLVLTLQRQQGETPHQLRMKAEQRVRELESSLAAEGEMLTFSYVNYRGERAERSVRPVRLYHGRTEHHPEPQWLLEAVDPSRGATRHFALKDMSFSASCVSNLALSPGEWTDAQVRDFLSVALRHVDVSGTLAADDIRMAFRYMAAGGC